MIGLALAFLATAALYASVGFAGGSTYNALLALSGVDHRVFPSVALVCNLIVATGGTIRFARAGLVPWRRMLPILLLSVPAAWLGGTTSVSKQTFYLLLGGSLLVAAALLFVQAAAEDREQRASWPVLVIAGPVGLLSGIVGIGGGIFLAPILHLTGWDRAQRVAAAACVFILANSVAALAGQVLKLADQPQLGAAIVTFWPLCISVLVGGQLGNRFGVKLLSPLWLRRLTGVLILFVAIRLLRQGLAIW